MQQFTKQFLKEIEEDNAAIFVGARLSAPAGYVNWKGLLRPLVDDLGLDIDRNETSSAWINIITTKMIGIELVSS